MPEVRSKAPGTAVYTGTFDPVHYGHIDVIARGSRIFDPVVGVGNNPEKSTFFTIEERADLVRRVSSMHANVEVHQFDGLAVKFVRDAGARIILRGIRTTSDMEDEFTMSLTNLALDPEIETVFLMAKETHSHISSTLLRQIATLGGELDKFVPALVKKALQERAIELDSPNLKSRDR